MRPPGVLGATRSLANVAELTSAPSGSNCNCPRCRVCRCTHHLWPRRPAQPPFDGAPGPYFSGRHESENYATYFLNALGDDSRLVNEDHLQIIISELARVSKTCMLFMLWLRLALCLVPNVRPVCSCRSRISFV